MSYRDTVTVVTPGTTTDYGQSTPDWTESAVVRADEPAWVGGSSTVEALTDGDKVVERLTVHLLPTTAATPTCRIEWRGDTYEIDGALLPLSRRGALHHYEAALKRTEG